MSLTTQSSAEASQLVRAHDTCRSTLSGWHSLPGQRSGNFTRPRVEMHDLIRLRMPARLAEAPLRRAVEDNRETLAIKLQYLSVANDMGYVIGNA
jgi:hypothetical protein